MKRSFFVRSAGLVLFAAACGDARPVSTGQQPGVGAGAVGPSTNTTPAQCTTPDLSGLTYANFGQSFFGSYCLRCHSVNVPVAARNGAPTDHNFDTLSDVQGLKDHIDQVAGMNPNGSVKNTAMPFNPPAPPDLDRQRLSCWIAAGLPGGGSTATAAPDAGTRTFKFSASGLSPRSLSVSNGGCVLVLNGDSSDHQVEPDDITLCPELIGGTTLAPGHDWDWCGFRNGPKTCGFHDPSRTLLGGAPDPAFSATIQVKAP